MIRSLTCSIAVAFAFTGANVVAQPTTFARASTVEIRAHPKGAPALARTETTALQRHVTVAAKHAPMADVLREIDKQAKLGLSYSPKVVPASRRITVDLKDVSAQEALETVLRGTGIRIGTGAKGQVVLMPASNDLSLADSVSGEIGGYVLEVTTKTPVPNATVLVVGTNIRQLTRSDGSFRIGNVPPGAYSLRVTRLGYQPSEGRALVKIGSTTNVQLEVTPVPVKLNDVITTSTGSQKRLEIGNSIASIKADSIVAHSPVRNLADLIAARAPGVEVMTTSGTVGAGSRIRVRGIGRVSGSNDPILIIDGVRAEADFSQGFKQFNLANTGAPFNSSATSRFDDIDPNSIESIDILKGPSAATLYGSDAANGVIVIRTKSGKAGPARWTFFADRGNMKIKSVFSDSYTGYGNSSVNGPGAPCTLVQVTQGYCAGIDSVTHFNPLNSKATTPFGTGFRSSLGAQVSGGTDRIQYFFGGDVQDDIGVLKMPDADVALLEARRHGDPIPDWQMHPNQFNKQSGDSRITTNFGTFGDLALTSNLTHQIQMNSNDTKVVQGALQGSGSVALNDGWSTDSPNSRPSDFFAPRGTNAITRGFVSLAGNARPFQWLSGRATLGADYTDRTDEYYLRPGDDPTATPATNGTRGRSEGNNTVYTADLGGTVSLPLNDMLSSRTSAGLQYTHLYSKTLTASGSGLAIGNTTFNGARTTTLTEAFDQSALAGLYVEETGVIRERLFLTAAIRQDAGSAFGKNAKAPIYPKLSLSWLLSQEPFFPKIANLTNFRVRAAFGHAGVQPTTTGAIRTYAAGSGFVDGIPVVTATLNSVGNDQILPERSTEFEGGADLSFLDDRVTVEGTYYNKLSKDAIVGRTLPPSLGWPIVASRQENVGSVKNTGSEWTVTAIPLQARQLSWNFTVNRASNRNRLVKLAKGVATLQNGQEQYTVGYPLSGRWDRPILGFKDINHDGIISPSEVTVGDSAVFVGQPVPDKEWSFSNTVGLLNNRVLLSALIDFQGGLGQVDQATVSRCYNGKCRASVDPTASLASQAAVAALSKPYPYNTTYAFDQTVSWTRLRNVTASLELPEQYAQWVHARSARISLLGENLRLWSRYSGADPEVNTNPYRNYILDNGGLPMTRNWSVRINLGF